MATSSLHLEWQRLHLGQHPSLDGIDSLYRMAQLIPTSTAADTVLIRSHIAYWSGHNEASKATIRPSRGHSYRVAANGWDRIVRITDYHDHRNGVTGWRC